MLLKSNLYYFSMHVHIRLYLIESPKVVHVDLFLGHAIYLIRYLIMNCTSSRKEVTDSYTKPTTRKRAKRIRLLLPDSVS
ncbi:Uncharacterized protein APZ42_013505 [Daphnia magna]|uniref:Uncharacterized protein n=1 Tax=Daphnia magna TaxID=35525 RepID=A0A0N8D6V3_9CRUS|nr:Uncharacterized protein APZ42_013505 [Daphnia magna]